MPNRRSARTSTSASRRQARRRYVAATGGAPLPRSGHLPLPPLVRLAEGRPGPLDVVRALLAGLRVPLAPRRREEVAPVDVDRSGEATERVGNGVDHLPAQHHRVGRLQLLAAGGDEAPGGPPVERVVLPA